MKVYITKQKIEKSSRRMQSISCEKINNKATSWLYHFIKHSSQGKTHFQKWPLFAAYLIVLLTLSYPQVKDSFQFTVE